MRWTPARRRRRMRSATRLAALSAALVVIGVTGCGGGDQPEPAPAAASPAAASPTAAAAAATAIALPPVIVSPDVLTSYRYAIALHVAGSPLEDASGAAATATPADLSGATFTITIEGEVVNPDRERARTKASLGFIELALERIQIGDRAWTREVGGEWKTATPGASSPVIGGDLDISPARIFAEHGSAFVALDAELRALAFTEDEVDGLTARRYELSPEQFRSMFGGEAGLLPGDSQPLDARGTLWIAEDSRLPVRIQLTSTDAEGKPAFEMDLTLTDLNASITIEPPL